MKLGEGQRKRLIRRNRKGRRRRKMGKARSDNEGESVPLEWKKKKNGEGSEEERKGREREGRAVVVGHAIARPSRGFRVSRQDKQRMVHSGTERRSRRLSEKRNLTMEDKSGRRRRSKSRAARRTRINNLGLKRRVRDVFFFVCFFFFNFFYYGCKWMKQRKLIKRNQKPHTHTHTQFGSIGHDIDLARFLLL